MNDQNNTLESDFDISSEAENNANFTSDQANEFEYEDKTENAENDKVGAEDTVEGTAVKFESDFTRESQIYYTYQTNDSKAVFYEAEKEELINQKSTISLVLGFVSVLASFLIIPISVVTGIISILSAVKSRKLSDSNKFNGSALAGFVCAIVGIVIYLFITFVVMLFVMIVLNNPDIFDVSWGYGNEMYV